MSDASVEQINNYSDFNTNPWLIEFFKESNIQSALVSFDLQFNKIEQVFYDMFTKLWLSDATGEQLDIIGVHVGIPRQGLSDNDYKDLLEVKIQLNISSGEPESLISAVRILYGTNDIEYAPEYPAKVGLYVENQTYTLNEALLLLELLPAGVGLILSEELLTETDEQLLTETDIPLLTSKFYKY